MPNRRISKDAIGPSEDWYGNNVALPCPVCGKLFIISAFLNHGQRRCPSCDRTVAQVKDNELAVEWPDEEIAKVLTRSELLAMNRLDEVVALVKEGGAVGQASIAAKLDKAERIAFVERDGRIIAVAAKKRPSDHHVRDIGQQSGYALNPSIAELGYVAVAKKFQGQRLSSKVVKRILFEFGAQYAFATTTEPKMRCVLASNGFRWVGHEWDSEVRNEKLSLWTRETQ